VFICIETTVHILYMVIWWNSYLWKVRSLAYLRYWMLLSFWLSRHHSSSFPDEHGIDDLRLTFGYYCSLFPFRVGGWVGRSGWLHTCGNWAWRREHSWCVHHQYQTSAVALLKCICCTGVAPTDAREFVQSLTVSSSPPLNHLKYSVLALGDSSYLHFCRAGRTIDSR